jgi:hypothetical protein
MLAADGPDRAVALLGGLLTTTLAADRAQSPSPNALLREQLSAETDALTGLPNRRAWQRLLDQARARYERLADPTVIAMLDLDRLKIINDSRGHAVGDAYLVTAAAAMQTRPARHRRRGPARRRRIRVGPPPTAPSRKLHNAKSAGGMVARRVDR